MKAGYLTTEFWITTATQVIGFLVLVGVLSAGDADTLASAVVKSIESIGVIVLQVATIVAYLKSRTEVKVADAEKEVELSKLDVIKSGGVDPAIVANLKL